MKFRSHDLQTCSIVPSLMCQNVYHRIYNIHIKLAEIFRGRSTSRKCNNGNSDNIGRKHFEQHLNILVDTAIIYYITELKLPENSQFPESAVANTRT
jgi:hypothetical protein